MQRHVSGLVSLLVKSTPPPNSWQLQGTWRWSVDKSSNQLVFSKGLAMHLHRQTQKLLEANCSSSNPHETIDSDCSSLSRSYYTQYKGRFLSSEVAPSPLSPIAFPQGSACSACVSLCRLLIKADTSVFVKGLLRLPSHYGRAVGPSAANTLLVTSTRQRLQSH